jgi:hypothetical protein
MSLCEDWGYADDPEEGTRLVIFDQKSSFRERAGVVNARGGVYVCMYVSVYVYVYVYVYVCVCVYIYIYIYIHVCIHIEEQF